MLGNFPLSEQPTYDELASQLNKRFGPGEQAEHFLLELRIRRRGARETLQELGQSIRELSALAYPELPCEVRERLAKGHFADSIDDPDIRGGIFRAHPQTLDEAVRAALDTESFLKVEKNRERGRMNKFSRALIGSEVKDQLNNPMPKEIAELQMTLTNLMKAVDQLKSDVRNNQQDQTSSQMSQPKSNEEMRKTIQCFNCSEYGHYACHCPHGNGNQNQGNVNGRTRRTGGTPTGRNGPMTNPYIRK